MTRVLVCGDWHGSAAAARHMSKEAQRQGCRVIVQVGDFGFWPHTDPDYVHHVNKCMLKNNMFVVWIDGNHENFDVLFGTDWPETRLGFSRIAERVLYAPRGHRWEWDGVRFLSLGGGYSIDKDWRLSQGPEGMYWWRQETITQADVMNCGTNAVDVMFSHDMPEGVDLGISLTHNSREDQWNRKAVRAVVDKVKPARLYHGHYHHANQTLLRIDGSYPVEINSLDMWRGVPLNSHWATLDLREIGDAPKA